MNLIQRELGPIGTNAYIVYDETKEAMIIDPAGDCPRILQDLREKNLQPKLIVLTHGHADHIGALQDLRKATGIPVYVGEGDKAMLQDVKTNLSQFMGSSIICDLPEYVMHDGDMITVGNMSFQVMTTPGHTKGGICLYGEGVVFVGDTLFQGSIGRTDLYGGYYEELLKSIDTKLMVLPDDVKVYPGHGPSTTIGIEKKYNPFVNGRG